MPQKNLQQKYLCYVWDIPQISNNFVLLWWDSGRRVTLPFWPEGVVSQVWLEQKGFSSQTGHDQPAPSPYSITNSGCKQILREKYENIAGISHSQVHCPSPYRLCLWDLMDLVISVVGSSSINMANHSMNVCKLSNPTMTCSWAIMNVKKYPFFFGDFVC